ncbi:MAG: hypothetical protein KAI40_11280 [Desulfobacterales bacterium]|nr:hypothetical protein [Desulfobacterales bacterium]
MPETLLAPGTNSIIVLPDGVVIRGRVEIIPVSLGMVIITGFEPDIVRLPATFKIVPGDVVPIPTLPLYDNFPAVTSVHAVEVPAKAACANPSENTTIRLNIK